jgi:hypothetical protein
MEWLFAVALIIGMIWLLSREQKRREARTEEEYQKDVEVAGRSLVGAAMFELQKTLQPEARPGIEYVLDEKKGMAEERQKTGDSSDPEE